MDTFKKIWHSKTPREMIMNIPYNALHKCIFIMLAIFIINPAIKTMAALTDIIYIDTLHIVFWSNYNRYFLLYGLIILALFVIKLKLDNKPIDIISTLKSNTVVKLFFMFVILMILSTLINGINKTSLFGHSYSAEGLLGYSSYILYFIFTLFFISDRQKTILLKIFAITSLFNVVMTAIDYIVFDRYFNFATGDSMFFNSNHYGYYLLVIAIFYATYFILCQKAAKKILSIICFMLTVGVLLINNTLGCQLALIIGIIFIGIICSLAKARFQVLTFVIFLAFLATCATGYVTSDTIRKNIDNNIYQLINDTNALKGDEHNSSTGIARLVLWEHTINHISEKPLLGHSADKLLTRLEEETGMDGRCHCDYLHYAVCFGIPAAIIYIVAIFLIYLRGLKYKSSLNNTNLIGLCCAIAYLASAMVGSSMFYTAPFLFIMLGLGYYSESDKEI